MTIFAHLRHSFEHLVHQGVDDVRAAGHWVGNHTVLPLAHLASSVGHVVGGVERSVVSGVRTVEHSVVSVEQSLVHGVQHGYRAISHEIAGAGQVIGGIAHRLGTDAEAALTMTERVGRSLGTAATYLPIVLMGGAVIWVAKKEKMLLN